MTTTNELNQLIEKAVNAGAKVTTKHDGGHIVTVQVFGLKGCGSFPMSPISAAERLRELV